MAVRQGGSGLQQAPRSVLENNSPPLELLSVDQLEAIHEASLSLLEEQGLQVMGARARDLFKAAGAQVDKDVVCLDRALVLELIAKAPSSFTITPRNPEKAIHLGGNRIYFGMVSGPPNVHDCINGRRAGNFDDYQKLIKLGHSLNAISLFGNQTVAPTDLPVNTRHLDCYRSNLTLTDKVFSAIPIGTTRVRDAVQMCALAHGLTMEEVSDRPVLMGNININSPRRLDGAMADAAIELAMLGQPVIVTPFTLMGAMAPVTLAAALVQQNAEALFGVCLVLLAGNGAPVVYGGFTSNVDMRSGAPAFGTPENAKANLAGGQLARRYGLPYRTSGCNASNVVDAQAVYETKMSLWSAVLGHGNLVYHAAGWLEGGLVASFEKVIIDAEVLGAITAVFSPIEINEEALGLSAIAGVEPGGHFFGAEHTMTRYENAFYQPLVSDWQNHENWELAGGLDATQRATQLWQSVLANYQLPMLDPACDEALDDYVAKRKSEIGNDALDE